MMEAKGIEQAANATVQLARLNAEQVMMEAKGIEQAANAAVQLARLNVHKERQYHASQITNSKSVS